MSKRGAILLIGFFIVATILPGCTAESKPEGEMLYAYTSIYPIYDFAKKVAGNGIEVELLVPPGAEPHGWEPSARTIANIENSQLLIYNGLDMDPWAERIARSISNEEVHIIALGEIQSIEPMAFHEDHDHEGEEEHGIYDPHIWLDPSIAQEMARAIKDQFIAIDPDNSALYEENFNEFQKQLVQLDQEYKSALSQRGRNEFIVSHAAFGYLAQRYGLKQIAISGLAPQAEPSPAKIAELTSMIERYHIHTIFFEELSSPKVAEVLADETGAVVDVLNPIGGLTQEEMDQGEDYLSIMRKNLEKLVKALN